MYFIIRQSQTEDGMFNFYALISRMKLIERWSLMRQTRKESLMEHAAEVAILAQALGLIKNIYFGGSVNIDRAASIALYHDTSEVISGDLPTPIKYFNERINAAYKEIEGVIAEKLLNMLPKDMSDSIKPYVVPSEEEYEYKLVKAADKLAAYIKCLEEKASGNGEFDIAAEKTLSALRALGYDEVNFFLDNFIEGFGKTLDML